MSNMGAIIPTGAFDLSQLGLPMKLRAKGNPSYCDASSRKEKSLNTRARGWLAREMEF